MSAVQRKIILIWRMLFYNFFKGEVVGRTNHVRVHACTRTQWCPTLWDPIDCSPPGSSVHGISQAKILEWVAISSSRGSFWPKNWTHVSCLFLLHWQAGALPLEPLEKGEQTFGFCLFVCATPSSLWILVLWPEIEPGPMAVKALSSNCWTTREVPKLWFECCFN